MNEEVRSEESVEVLNPVNQVVGEEEEEGGGRPLECSISCVRPHTALHPRTTAFVITSKRHLGGWREGGEGVRIEQVKQQLAFGSDHHDHVANGRVVGVWYFVPHHSCARMRVACEGGAMRITHWDARKCESKEYASGSPDASLS